MTARETRGMSRLVHRIVDAASSLHAVVFAGLIIVVWAASGPVFHFSNLWQLAINTGTTIITFLVGFAILYTSKVEADEAKRRDKALHAKIDALIESISKADNRLVGLEDETEDAIDHLAQEVRNSAG